MFTDNGYCNNALLGKHPILKLVDEKMKKYDPTKSSAVKYGFVSDHSEQYIKSIIKAYDTELIWTEFNTYASGCYLDIDSAIDKLCSAKFFNMLTDEEWSVVLPCIDVFDFRKAYDLPLKNFLNSGLNIIDTWDAFIDNYNITNSIFCEDAMSYGIDWLRAKLDPLMENQVNCEYVNMLLQYYKDLQEFLNEWPRAYRTIRKDVIEKYSLMRMYFTKRNDFEK